MTREVLQQALEALLDLQSLDSQDVWLDRWSEAITAIQEALAQPEQEQLEEEQESRDLRTPKERRDAGQWHCPECFTFGHVHRRGCVSANKKILENPQWVMPKNEPERDETLARPERSMKVEGPLHVICQCDKCKPQIAFNAEVVGYVAPQRTWVGLTEWEREAIAVECGAMSADWLVFMEAVERALKEKNT